MGGLKDKTLQQIADAEKGTKAAAAAAWSSRMNFCQRVPSLSGLNVHNHVTQGSRSAGILRTSTTTTFTASMETSTPRSVRQALVALSVPKMHV